MSLNYICSNKVEKKRMGAKILYCNTDQYGMSETLEKNGEIFNVFLDFQYPNTGLYSETPNLSHKLNKELEPESEDIGLYSVAYRLNKELKKQNTKIDEIERQLIKIDFKSKRLCTECHSHECENYKCVEYVKKRIILDKGDPFLNCRCGIDGCLFGLTF